MPFALASTLARHAEHAPTLVIFVPRTYCPLKASLVPLTLRSRPLTPSCSRRTSTVTRGELKAELEQFEIRLKQKLEQKLEQKFDQKLELWGGALLARIEAGEQRMIQRMEGMEQRLLAELARHAGAIQESVSKQISVIDEKYADLPSRVSRLEAKVFTPRRR